MKAYVKDGTVKYFGLWDPGMLGYLGVYAAAEKASGADLAAGFTAGGTDYKPDSTGVDHRRAPAGVQRREHRPVQVLTDSGLRRGDPAAQATRPSEDIA